MMIFAFGIEHPLDMTVQRLHDADPRHQRRPASGHQQQHPRWRVAEWRQRATREGFCYQHVQAITVAIDQYAEKALGNRDYFLDKPYGAG